MVVTAAICGTVIYLAGCQLAGSRSSFPPGHSTAPVDRTPPQTTAATHEPSPSSAGATATASGNVSCGSATVNIDYAPFTTADLAISPWELVVADVNGQGPAFFNTEDGARPPLPDVQLRSPDSLPNAETMVYTPVEVEVDHSINGPLLPGPNRFLIAGGVVGCYTMRVYPSPAVELGSRYVFILATVFDNSGTNELSSKEAKFAWPVDDDGTVATVDGPMSIGELTKIVNEPRPSLPPG